MWNSVCTQPGVITIIGSTQSSLGLRAMRPLAMSTRHCGGAAPAANSHAVAATCMRAASLASPRKVMTAAAWPRARPMGWAGSAAESARSAPLSASSSSALRPFQRQRRTANVAVRSLSDDEAAEHMQRAAPKPQGAGRRVSRAPEPAPRHQQRHSSTPHPAPLPLATASTDEESSNDFDGSPCRQEEHAAGPRRAPERVDGEQEGGAGPDPRVSEAPQEAPGRASERLDGRPGSALSSADAGPSVGNPDAPIAFTEPAPPSLLAGAPQGAHSGSGHAALGDGMRAFALPRPRARPHDAWPRRAFRSAALPAALHQVPLRARA